MLLVGCRPVLVVETESSFDVEVLHPNFAEQDNCAIFLLSYNPLHLDVFVTFCLLQR